MKSPRKYFQVKPEVNHNRIGCGLTHFVLHIENKPLQAQWMDNKNVNLIDETGKPWTILRTDVTEVNAPAHA